MYLFFFIFYFFTLKIFFSCLWPTTHYFIQVSEGILVFAHTVFVIDHFFLA